MRKFTSRAGLIACTVGAAVLAFSGPASAATTGGGVAAGTGTISPGLTLAGQPQFPVSFSGTAAGTGSPASATGAYTCGTNDTNDTIGSYSAGAGVGNLACTAIAVATGTSAGPISYQRNGSAVVVHGNLAGGSVPGVFTAVCLFEPTSGPTITSYALQCAFAFGV